MRHRMHRTPAVATTLLVGLSCGGAGDSAGTEDDHARTLTVEAPFELCLVSGPRFSGASEPTRNRALVSPGFSGERTVPLPPADLEAETSPIPFFLTERDGNVVDIEVGEATATIRTNSVPDYIWNFAEGDFEYDTVRYSLGHLTVLAGTPSTSEDFRIDDIPSLDRSKLFLSRYVRPEQERESGRPAAGLLAPCRAPSVVPDQYRFSFEGGQATFDTRPAVWESVGGFALRADVSTEEFSFVSTSYWDLDYQAGNLGSRGYRVDPLLATRIPDGGHDSCFFVVQQVPEEPTWTGQIVNCDGDVERTFAIDGAVFVPGGGAPPVDTYLDIPED